MISHELDPLLHKLGLPSAVSYGVAFAVAMVVVVFLHMVVGEMAPKSWAIAHPERSAMLLSPPFRAVVRAVHPLIRLLNAVSNALVRLCRVAPRDELASVHDREQLTRLVEESERLGLISATDSELLTRSLTEPETPVAALRIPAAEITWVEGGADVDALLRSAAEHDRTRLLVRENGIVLGSVHARDALVARARGRATTARELARPVPELTESTTVADAIEVLRRRRSSLAVVRDPMRRAHRTGHPGRPAGPSDAAGRGGLTGRPDRAGPNIQHICTPPAGTSWGGAPGAKSVLGHENLAPKCPLRNSGRNAPVCRRATGCVKECAQFGDPVVMAVKAVT